MIEYINKDRLIRPLEAWLKDTTIDTDTKDVVSHMIGIVHTLPTIDIVHCAECKHRHEYEEYDRAIDEFIDCSYCARDGKYHDDDWFCAGGER